jgi:hypothetical protein
MNTERWVIQGERAGGRPCWLQTSIGPKGDVFASWTLELPGASRYHTAANAEQTLQAHTTSGGWPGLVGPVGGLAGYRRASGRTVRIRRAGEASLEGRQAVARVVKDAILGERYGYLTEADLETLTAYEPLRQVLVRCAACRFVTAAASVRHIVAALEAYHTGDGGTGRGLDYCRDVCLPSSDPGWQQYRTDRAAADAGHRPFYAGGRPA